MVTSHRLGGIGHSTKFEFQYTPDFGKTTEMGAFDTGSWQRAAILATVGIVLGAVAMAFIADMIYPWQQLAAQRMAMVIPVDEVLERLL